MNRELASLYPDHLSSVRTATERALEASGLEGLVVVGGAQRMIFLDDMPYPYKVNPHLKWWVPVLDNPNCLLSFKAGERPVLVYWQPADYWHKPASDPEGFWVEHFDVRVVRDPSEARAQLAEDLSQFGVIGENPEEVEDWGFASENPDGLLDRLHFARAWKSEYEIECMRRANEAAARGHVAAAEAFRAGATEYEIHLAYVRATGHTENELPYGNIIALNEHAAVLHYQMLEREHSSQERRSFLIDAGATFHGYASDITRTYSARNDEFDELVGRMDRAQQDICGMVRPGRDYREVHFFAHRKVGEILADMKFTSMSADAAYESGVTRTFLPHGVGHYIGLQTHDVGGFMADETGRTIPKPEGHPFLRLTRTVEEGQVFTIEPGLYFIDMLLAELREGAHAKEMNWERIDSFRPFGGVRIEDDIVVRSGGHENLTRAAFSSLR